MKQTTIYSYAVTGLLAVGASGALASCTRDFQEVNTNPLRPNDEVMKRDNLGVSANIPDLLFQPLYTALGGTGAANNYQVIDNLMVQSWMGYMAPRDAKWNNNNLSQYSFGNQGWLNGAYVNTTQSVLGPWLQVKKATMDGAEKHPELFAIAQITKIMALHRGVDMFGAIPYSKVGSGSFTVPYDSQEAIYTSFFQELTDAVNALRTWGQISTLDYVYGGNAKQWMKLGNSLMLRLAMRVRFAAPELSKKYAEQAANDPAGLIVDNADNAWIGEKLGIKPVNSLYIVAKAYDDTRMGASVYTYLKGYNDPRLSVYFEPYKKGEEVGNLDTAVPPAIPQTGDKYNKATCVKVGNWDPSVWMTASEVEFLLAEAAVANYAVPGTAQSHYENGVKRSFEQFKLDGADAYLKGSGKPIPFKDNITPEYSADAPATVTVKWDEGLNEEQKLEKIITQKYLALFPNGMEAWSEWRRTGYPLLIKPNGNISTHGMVTSDGHKDGMRIFPYPQDEIDKNAENVNAAINSYRGGSNAANVNVWWDKKEK